MAIAKCKIIFELARPYVNARLRNERTYFFSLGIVVPNGSRVAFCIIGLLLSGCPDRLVGRNYYGPRNVRVGSNNDLFTTVGRNDPKEVCNASLIVAGILVYCKTDKHQHAIGSMSNGTQTDGISARNGYGEGLRLSAFAIE